MMIKHILTIIALTISTSVNAQSLKDLFLQMPQEICPLLSEYNKLELVDNQKNDKQMVTTNIMHSFSEMTTLTDRFARLKTTKNTEKTFKLLTRTDGASIIAVVSTVFIDNAPDSHLDFYTTEWQPINTADIIDIEQTTGFHYFEMKGDSDNLRIVSGNPLNITLDGSNKLPKVETTSQTLQWNGERFQ